MNKKPYICKKSKVTIMFEYMFSLVTDEFKVVGEGQETQHSKEQNKVEKSVKGKFIRDLEALRDNGYSLSSGSNIEICLQDILKICPRDRRRVDAYNSLKAYLNDEFDCSLCITSQKTKGKED